MISLILNYPLSPPISIVSPFVNVLNLVPSPSICVSWILIIFPGPGIAKSIALYKGIAPPAAIKGPMTGFLNEEAAVINLIGLGQDLFIN